MENNVMLYALFITALGMGIVFAVLILLRYIIELMRITFKQNNTKKTADSVRVISEIPEYIPVEQADKAADDNELVAVITAAVAACLGGKRDLVVRSITRVGDSSPVWARTGRQEQMSNRF
ncbi:MAG: OadG family protein [Bacillota bacterium]